MNDTTIETVLFHAPCPAVPADLLKRLQAGIPLQPAGSRTEKSHAWQNPLRRWFPALVFGLLLLSSAIMIAVQGSWSANLKQQNETLRTATANLAQLRERHATFEKAQAQQEELNQLQKENREMIQLQAEVTQLRSLSGKIRRLQDENRRLSTTPTIANTPTGGANFFDEAQQQAERIQCVNNLKQLGLAMRIWASDNNDKYPASMVVMSNELNTVKILICPSDKGRAGFSSPWAVFQDAMSSYDFLAQPDDEAHPDCIAAKCPIHSNYLLADGSVQMVNPEKVGEVKRDGRLYLQQINPGSAK